MPKVHEDICRAPAGALQISAMPAGQYEMVANQWNQHTSKAGNQSIKVEFDVVGPSHAGRKVWEYFTVEGNAVTTTARRVKS